MRVTLEWFFLGRHGSYGLGVRDELGGIEKIMRGLLVGNNYLPLCFCRTCAKYERV